MTDAVFTVGNTNYSMSWGSLANNILYQHHTYIKGSLRVTGYDYCKGKSNTYYSSVQAFIYNKHLYIWLCDDEYTNQHRILVSDTQYIPPGTQTGKVHITAKDTTGKDISVGVWIVGTNQHGWTPLTWTLPVGTQKITAMYGDQQKTITINVEANKVLNIEFTFNPITIKVYGKVYDWEPGATHLIAYKIWNPLGKPIDWLLQKMVDFDNELMSRGWKLVNVQFDTSNDVMLVWLYKMGSPALVAIAALIVVAVIVGFIVYGWVTASQTKIEYQKSYQSYTQYLEDEDKRLDEQLEKGLITKDEYTKLVAAKHSTKPPNTGGLGAVPWKTILIGAGGVAGIYLISKIVGRKRIEEVVYKGAKWVKSKVRGNQNG